MQGDTATIKVICEYMLKANLYLFFLENSLIKSSRKNLSTKRIDDEINANNKKGKETLCQRPINKKLINIDKK